MIKNERQYKITRVQAERFNKALRVLEVEQRDAGEVHPLLLKARKDALRSQLTELESDLREYEDLKVGMFEFEQLSSIAELPKLLIRARIASGLSQRDLADRLGLKEQQLQRYEATDYSSASFSRIISVAAALGVNFGESVLGDGAIVSLKSLLKRVSETGLPAEFIRERLIPHKRQPLSLIANERDEAKLTHATAETICKIFRWPLRDLLSGQPLELKTSVGGVRFKAIANANPERVDAYTVYAHYLSLLISQASEHHPIRTIPTNPFELRSEIASKYGSISLDSIVNCVWDFGVPVLPLDDPGVFHGACFREGGRNIIVLKQNTSSESRWAFDLLHELWHSGQEPDSPERTVLEPDEGATGENLSDEEKTASRFAAAVMLNGRGPELAEECLREANYDMRRLKVAVGRIALKEGISVDALANYMAFRLAVEQNQNWWGTASRLQEDGNPWSIVRNVFFERADLTKLAEPDRELVSQALTPRREISHV